MSYEMKRLENQPALVTTFNEDFDATTELEPLIVEMRQQVSNEANPIYVIIDLSAYNISLNDLFVGTSLGMKSQKLPHREESMAKTLKTIIVTEQPILQASLKGFERFGFSNNLEIASSLDEALQIIESAA